MRNNEIMQMFITNKTLCATESSNQIYSIHRLTIIIHSET